MRYFKFGLNPSDKVWRKYKNFGIEFFNGSTSLSPEELFTKKHFKTPPTLRPLVGGLDPTFSTVGANCIVIKQDILSADEFVFSGLTLIPVVDESTGDTYVALCFDQAIDCVDLEKSEYEPWPNGIAPSQWSNPIGRFFEKPTLRLEKIPPRLDVFTLANWGGAYNLIVNSEVKNRLVSLKDANKFVVFTELSIE